MTALNMMEFQRFRLTMKQQFNWLRTQTKHKHIQRFFVREKVTEGKVGVNSISVELQVADALIKPLLGPRL